MSKIVQIPINEFDYFTSDGTYVGVKFRYRLKEDITDNNTSQWSEPTELIFKDANNNNMSLSAVNGYDDPLIIGRDSPINSIRLESFRYPDKAAMMPSQIDQIISQTSLTEQPNPQNDLYRLSFITPEKFNIGKFDIFQSWRGVAYVHPTADITAPSGSGPFTGTLTLSGTGGTLRTQTLKSYYDWFVQNVSGQDLALYAAAGSVTPGNTFVITGYSRASFAIRSDRTWTSSGDLTHISRINAWTEPEYLATIETNNYEFSRKMKSNKVSATLVEGSSVVRLDQDVATSGIVSGMTITKLSGDGRFRSNSVISQIDYQNNLLFISTSLGETNTAVPSATISSVSNPSAGVWTATISTASISSQFEVGYMISATPGVPGTLGDGLVRVTSTNNVNQITVQSNKAITAGTITNIVTIFRNNHTAPGYIEFVGDASTQFNMTYSGSTNIRHNWISPLFCQTIITAPTKDRDWTNLYTVLSVSENQVVYSGGLGRIQSSSGATAPFTATITGMSMPYAPGANNSGFRIYANPTTTGGDSFGNGEVKVARYVSGNRIDITSTAEITNGFVYGIRL
jgi:hypothetical protein